MRFTCLFCACDPRMPVAADNLSQHWVLQQSTGRRVRSKILLLQRSPYQRARVRIRRIATSLESPRCGGRCLQWWIALWPCCRKNTLLYPTGHTRPILLRSERGAWASNQNPIILETSRYRWSCDPRGYALARRFRACRHCSANDGTLNHPLVTFAALLFPPIRRRAAGPALSDSESASSALRPARV